MVIAWLLLYGSSYEFMSDALFIRKFVYLFMYVCVCMCLCVAPCFCPGSALHPCPDAPFVYWIDFFMDTPHGSLCVVSAMASVRMTTVFTLCKDG